MKPSRMIVVPGHGVCARGLTGPGDVERDESWFGIFPDEGPLYVEHVRHAVILTGEQSEALLVFSGGQTRREAGPRSEAESYLEIAADAGWFGRPEVAARCRAEEYARDSLENLLFSIALFLGEAGRPPEHVTVVGWKFKCDRFDLHRRALAWPAERFSCAGVNDPPGAALARARAAEAAKLAAAQTDPLLRGPIWAAQRRGRDPFSRGHPYHGVDERLDRFLDHLDGRAARTETPW